MAEYVIDISRYDRDLHALRIQLTDVSAAGYRFCKSSSQQHTIVVQGPNDLKCTLWLRESDLYFIGFKVGEESYHWNDTTLTGVSRSTKLTKFSEKYTKRGGPIRGNFAYDDICKAIETLGSFKPDRSNTRREADGLYIKDTELYAAMSKAMGVMCILISEALRFRDVASKTSAAARNSGNGGYICDQTQLDLMLTWEDETDKYIDKAPGTDLKYRKLDRPSKLEILVWHRKPPERA